MCSVIENEWEAQWWPKCYLIQYFTVSFASWYISSYFYILDVCGCLSEMHFGSPKLVLNKWWKSPLSTVFMYRCACSNDNIIVNYCTFRSLVHHDNQKAAHWNILGQVRRHLCEEFSVIYVNYLSEMVIKVAVCLSID